MTRWSDAEDLVLSTHFGTSRARELSVILNRTRAEIANRACDLGLTRDNRLDGFSEETIRIQTQKLEERFIRWAKKAKVPVREYARRV